MKEDLGNGSAWLACLRQLGPGLTPDARLGRLYKGIWRARAGVKDFHPHKFRATYASRLLHSGIDLKDVQKLMGHKTIESTMRYLARSEETISYSAKIDSVFETAFGNVMGIVDAEGKPVTKVYSRSYRSPRETI